MRRYLSVLVLGLMLLSTACSSKSLGASKALAQSAEESAEAKNVRFEASMEFKGIGLDESMTMSGVFDFEHKRSKIEVDFMDETFEQITDGDTVYIRSDLLGEGWISMDTDMGAAFNTNASDIFDNLKDAVDVKREGSDEVDGISVTRYSYAMDLQDTFESLGVPADSLGDDLPTLVSARTWIDDKNLVRRIEIAVSTTSGEHVFKMTMTFFDYDKAPAIELPDPEDVSETPSFGGLGGGSLGDPFAGADCYGEAVDDCLAPNPEVDAMAQDPAICMERVPHVCLVPLGNIRRDIVQAIVDFHKRTKNLDVIVLPSIAIPASMVDRGTSQLASRELYDLMRETYSIPDDAPASFIAVSPIDLKPADGKYSWFFGERYHRRELGQQNGVFSYFRMENVEPYDGRPLTDKLIQERAVKYFARYTTLLYFDVPEGDDINYLNYSDMFGFSDLDSLKPNWPAVAEKVRPCVSEANSICITGDRIWSDEFESDYLTVLDRLETQLGVRIELSAESGYYPSKDSWSEEFHQDLLETAKRVLARPNTTVIGVTDDDFAQGASIPAHMEAAWPTDRIAVVSMYGGGKPGTAEHRERLYRLLLRAAAVTHFGKALNGDPGSLLWEGATKPEDLDRKSIPALP